MDVQAAVSMRCASAGGMRAGLQRRAVEAGERDARLDVSDVVAAAAPSWCATSRARPELAQRDA